MRSISSLIIYAASLAPIAAISLFINDAAASQIINRLESVAHLLATLNRTLF